jgi:hypothetical protein
MPEMNGNRTSERGRKRKGVKLLLQILMKKVYFPFFLLAIISLLPTLRESGPKSEIDIACVA